MAVKGKRDWSPKTPYNCSWYGEWFSSYDVVFNKIMKDAKEWGKSARIDDGEVCRIYKMTKTKPEWEVAKLRINRIRGAVKVYETKESGTKNIYTIPVKRK